MGQNLEPTKRHAGPRPNNMYIDLSAPMNGNFQDTIDSHGLRLNIVDDRIGHIDLSQIPPHSYTRFLAALSVLNVRYASTPQELNL